MEDQQFEIGLIFGEFQSAIGATRLTDIVKRLRAADLLVKFVQSGEDAVVYVGATTARYEEEAERAGLLKSLKYESGYAPFTREKRHMFGEFALQRDFFSSSERLDLLWRGVVSPSKYNGAGIPIEKLSTEKTLSDIVYLHNHNLIAGIIKESEYQWPWNMFHWHSLPVQSIRDYIDSQTALYFLFVSHMIKGLCILAPLSVIFLALRYDLGSDAAAEAVWSIITVAWVLYVSAKWVRVEEEQSHSWGISKLFPPLAVTGSRQANQIHEINLPSMRKLQIMRWQRFGSFLLTLLSFAATSIGSIMVSIVIKYLQGEPGEQERRRSESGVVVFAVLDTLRIFVFKLLMNKPFKRIRHWLSKQQNDRHSILSGSNDDRLASSLEFAFDVVNTFCTTIYILYFAALNQSTVFGRQMQCYENDCMNDVAYHIMMISIFVLLVDVVWMMFFPVYERWSNKELQIRQSVQKAAAAVRSTSLFGSSSTGSQQNPKQQKSEFSSFEPAIVESQLKPFVGIHTFYSKLFINLASTVLFASAFPMAAIGFLFSLVITARLQLRQILLYKRRSRAVQQATIGFWKSLMDLIVMLALFTNGTIIVFISNDMQKRVESLPQSDGGGHPVQERYFSASYWIIFVVTTIIFVTLRWLLNATLASLPTSKIMINLAKEQNAKLRMGLVQTAEQDEAEKLNEANFLARFAALPLEDKPILGRQNSADADVV